ncbi:hypothetical protein BGZ83_010892 [Gryganskiella cystojenkinii]|nr:hypothetical protein BGZ83_010892 [Gryganskiella cystojenkinii]
MIISTHFWVASVVISIIKIIISGTIGAIAGFYVKHCRDEYSNSIRWSRTGGLYEMVTLCRNTFGRLSARSRAVMALMIVVNISTLFVTILLGASVSHTKKTTNGTNKGVFTQQPVPMNNVLEWTNWIAYMEADATIEGTMTSYLNDIMFNPSPSPETVYTPLRHTYDIPCTETGAVIAKNTSVMPLVYPSPHDNCKVAFFMTTNSTYLWDETRASNQLISPGLHMAVAPVTFNALNSVSEFEPLLMYYYSHKLCDLTQPSQGSFITFPKDGLTALPRTDTTRCQYGSDDSFVITATKIRFAVNHLSDFDKVTAMIFDDPSNLPLLKVMNTAINNGTFASPTNSTYLVVLTNIADNVGVLVCASKFLGQPNDMGLLCIYVITATIVTKPQLWDPTVATDLNRNSSLPVDPHSLTNQNDISIYHMPPLSSNSDMITYSAAHLLETTTNVTEYFASLGHNAIMDSETGRFYVNYNTVELKDAFEVSTALLIVLGCIVVICCLIWGISQRWYPTVFNGSLYNLIYKEIQQKEKETPMLMNFKHDPLAFGGYLVIPDLGEKLHAPSTEIPATAGNKTSTQKSSQQRKSSQPLSVRQSPKEREKPTQNQFLTAENCPTTTDTPVIIDINNSSSATIFTPSLALATSTPIMPPSIPPRPLNSLHHYTPLNTYQPSPTLHTKSHSTQVAPSSPSANQEPTPIQSPFW